MTTATEEQKDALWRTNKDRLPFLRMIAKEVVLPLERIMMEADLTGCRQLVKDGLAVEGDLIAPKDYSLEREAQPIAGFALTPDGIELYLRLATIEASSATKFPPGDGATASEALHGNLVDDLVEIRKIANEQCPPPQLHAALREGFLAIDALAERAINRLKGE